ncbi:Stk1 family PASTA domain-containing Ser/Thr kinase [Desertibacillus haloalkaliphilus]|uniref:Stk1 family PASTA domain-containing Ser/Thr kinase n=1 Tax=Desertibacillus haloalkaliphilus TaxID=1328930 RepID=UPI001C26E833|nr:Stk1 family PASTA domain-containing Ser/Thr kinase [Desertibacillus haloalkaliphilus]MBU8907059.1 Stk1 family PASTA domain-containing Ser/Thr kinase [Desertibacillus haloalkaliphilus]
MIGRRINGRYEILETIGGGGMANVYKAIDRILDRYVAVKVLQPQFSDDEEFIKRFRREAQAATSLAHENVVSIYDVGQEDAIYYIVMEYVEGSTLKEFIKEQGRLSMEQTVEIFVQVTSAIAHAHVNQIIHRDIKPHNILISSNGEAKVTDFGIARAISSATITHTNSVMGSVHYLSPEQARGGVVNAKSDIYSLGIVLYEMVTGNVPFFGDTAVSIAIKHLQNEVPSPKEINPLVPQSIENVILKATAKDPFERYESVQEMEEDLSTALDPERLHEPKIELLADDEVTKAIPIVKEPTNDEDLDKTINVSRPPKPSSSTRDAPEKKPKNKKKKIMTWLFLLTFLLIGSVATAVVILPSLFKVDDVRIPDVTEMEFEEAVETLEELGLQVDREEDWDDEVAENYVIRTNPRANTSVKVNTSVTVVVSLGKETVPMQNVIGFDYDRAHTQLTRLGYKVERVKKEETGTKNVVIDQEPKEGDEIVPEETTVILTVRTPPSMMLSDLRGVDEQEALDIIRSEGLVIGDIQQEHSDRTEGTVIRQSPEQGSEVTAGQKVDLVVSLGPEPEPEPEPEVRSKLIHYPIEVFHEYLEEGQSFHVEIHFDDVTTDDFELFVEEEITETKVYQIPLEVSREKPGSYIIFLNSNIEEEGTVEYDE